MRKGLMSERDLDSHACDPWRCSSVSTHRTDNRSSGRCGLCPRGNLNTQTGEISRTGIFTPGRGTALADRGRTSAPPRVPDDCSPTRTLGGIVIHRDSRPGRTRTRFADLRRSWFSGLIVGVRTEWSFCHVGDSVRVIKIGDGSCGSPDHSIAGDSHARPGCCRSDFVRVAGVPGTGQAVTWCTGNYLPLGGGRHRPGRGRPCPSGGSGVAS
jgi:hypothetical protein